MRSGLGATERAIYKVRPCNTRNIYSELNILTLYRQVFYGQLALWRQNEIQHYIPRRNIHVDRLGSLVAVR